jgi:polyphenol oxidase
MRLQSTSLSARDGIAHGFFTRDGGVSGGIYGTLNCGPGSKDRPEDVAENRRRVAHELGTVADRLVSPYQYHSAEVFVAEGPWTREDAPRADALVTKEPGLAIGVSTADCVPVLFADAEAGVAGAAHAGWRGALSGVLEATLDAMEMLGARRAAIAAAVGPAISQTAYEVGAEFRDTFLQADAANARFFTVPSTGAKPHFDLPGYAAMRLREAGLIRVDELNICTYPQENRLFSYRRSCHKNEGDYGRQISAIVIPR